MTFFISCAVQRFIPHSTGVLRNSQDAVLVSLALLHGTLLLLFPSIPLFALGLWWNANTVSHNFIHLPFFRTFTANARFSMGLSLLLGFPQSLWASRHLAHHRDQVFRWKPIRRAWLVEGALVLALWATLLLLQWKFFLGVYLPGWAIGLALCQLQGRFEHSRGAVSHHGRLYNWLLFNDGYHVEHHAQPRRHWTQLPHQPHPDPSHISRWPALLRWLEHASLDGLEELVFRSSALRRFVLHVHQRALTRALAMIPPPRRVIIVGGGLFPRTALVLRQLVPQATLIIVDLRPDRLLRARHWLMHPGEAGEASTRPDVQFVCGYCTPENLPSLVGEADLVVVPLALKGAKDAFYGAPPAPHVLVHDWIWNSRGASTVVSIPLLKRLNLIRS